MTNRRRLLQASAAMAALGLGGCASPGFAPVVEADTDAAPRGNFNIIEDLAQRTFRFFWETSDPGNGLAPDRWPTSSPSSIAAIGFALTAYCVGVDRGYIAREQARDRTALTLRFLRQLPQGPQASGVAGHKGFFYHFLEMDTGLRAGDCELSTVDTALLLCGALHAQVFFSGEHPAEVEIRRLADELTTRVDWHWAQTRPPSISLGWTPEEGFLPYDWRGYNEAAVVYLLALGHPTRPLERAAWTAWTKEFQRNWSTFYGSQGLQFPPLFGHQYSSVWVDFRGIRDAFTRRHGIDYYENCAPRRLRAARLRDAQPARLGRLRRRRLGPHRLRRAGRDDGAARGPAAALLRPMPRAAPAAARRRGRRRHHRADRRRLVDRLRARHRGAGDRQPCVRRYGSYIYGKYGFFDSFNPSFNFQTAKLSHGRVVPGFGWVATDYLGIDQGPILAMIANYTDGSVWQTMTRSPQIRRGLLRAGFTGGWLEDE